MPRVRRAFKVLYWTVALLVLLALVFFLAVMPWAVATITTTNRFHFPDPNDGKTPRDFGMEYQPAEFQSSDGIDLKGWWMPAAVAPPGAAAGTIVYVHGQNRTRVEMVPMAQFAHSMGYNGLVFDLRHEGASGGRVSSVGYWERLDVEAAVRYALDQQHAQRPVVLWGISLGAAASLMAAAETPDVAAVISDSTFLSLDDTARHHWGLFFGWLPTSFPMFNETMALISWKAHFRPSDFDLRKAVDGINPRPILFIGVEGDRRMPPAIARTLYGLATGPGKMLLIVPGTRHGEGFTSGHEQYEQAVREFLGKVKAGP
ncbi:MAG TPA: alpha/beta hydrolase [Terriglobia bacterium]|nr:alpha/beta hydrolase [Terriglobia bacterium]